MLLPWLTMWLDRSSNRLWKESLPMFACSCLFSRSFLFCTRQECGCLHIPYVVISVLNMFNTWFRCETRKHPLDFSLLSGGQLLRIQGAGWTIDYIKRRSIVAGTVHGTTRIISVAIPKYIHTARQSVQQRRTSPAESWGKNVEGQVGLELADPPTCSECSRLLVNQHSDPVIHSDWLLNVYLISPTLYSRIYTYSFISLIICSGDDPVSVNRFYIWKFSIHCSTSS